MIYVYTTRIDTPSVENFQVFIKLLSPVDQAKAGRFVHVPDRHRLIAGRLALRYALKDLGIDHTGESFSLSAYGRPEFGRQALDFNISHSGDVVVCAISLTAAVGIDIEEIRPLVYQDFASCFSPSEWRMIEANDTLRTFYTFWTMKEAAIKANGKGLSIPLSEVVIKHDTQVCVQSEIWHVTSLNIDRGYICHVASQAVARVIRTIHFDLNSFFQ